MMIKKINIAFVLLMSIYSYSQKITNDFNNDKINDVIDYKCFKVDEIKGISEPTCKITLRMGKSDKLYKFNLSYVANPVISSCGTGCISLYDASRDTEYTTEYVYNKKYDNWILIKDEIRYNYENGKIENNLSKDYLLGIDGRKYKIISNDSVKAQTKKDNPNIVDEFYADLDKDGVKDKIVVNKNLNKNTDYEQEHFQLPIKIFKGDKKLDYKLWYNNDLLLSDNINTCTSEGYSNIVIKNNFFTIESHSCYDYNILVSVYMTFKVAKNEIYLYKYSEEYFDKYNHERTIPTKMLTVKDFGKMEFDKVSMEVIKKHLGYK